MPDQPEALRHLAPGIYYQDDLHPGDWYETGAITVTEAHIVNFAGVSGDMFHVHMDDEFARAEGFPGRIAHGILGLAMVDGLKNRAEVQLKGIAALHWDWSFTGAIVAGDRIRARLVVTEARATKRPERGILTLWFDVTNQRGETVQTGSNKLLMQRHATEA